MLHIKITPPHYLKYQVSIPNEWESPPAWPQEANLPLRSKYLLFCTVSGGGGGCEAGVGYPSPRQGVPSVPAGEGTSVPAGEGTSVGRSVNIPYSRYGVNASSVLLLRCGGGGVFWARAQSSTLSKCSEPPPRSVIKGELCADEPKSTRGD